MNEGTFSRDITIEETILRLQSILEIMIFLKKEKKIFDIEELEIKIQIFQPCYSLYKSK